MISYKVKNHIVTVYKVVDIGPLSEEKEVDKSIGVHHDEKVRAHWRDEYPHMDYTLEAVRFAPSKIVTLDDGSSVTVLDVELPDLKIGDYIRYEVANDCYVMHDFNAFKNYAVMPEVPQYEVRSHTWVKRI